MGECCTKKFKKGDKIFIIKSRNNAQHLEGQICEITCAGSSYYSVNAVNGGSYAIYHNGSRNDDFCEPTREAKAEFKRIKLSALEKEVTELKREIHHLEEFKTEEDFVAHKLYEILRVKGDKKAIAKVLKELKGSHLL